MRHREDDVLDEIDRLVDESLARGDQSDTFHGAQYRTDNPCPYCSEGWHLLPITQRMQEMRYGSYAVDEFQQGIVDPDYRYQEDESRILCPGSTFLAPPTNDREWEWCKRYWGRPQASSGWVRQPGRTYYSTTAGRGYGERRHADLPADSGSLRFRFRGPFEPWVISLTDDRDVERDLHTGNLTVRGRRLTCELNFDTTILVPMDMVNDWMHYNGHDVEEHRLTRDGVECIMENITFSYREVFVAANDPAAQFPDYIEISTDYPILQRHPWLGSYGWEPVETQNHDCCDECTPGVYHHLDHGECNSGAAAMYSAAHRRGYEADYVIIDEAHEFQNTEMRIAYAESFAQAVTALTRAAGLTEEEATHQTSRWRSAVLRSGPQVAEELARRVANQTSPGAIQEALSAAFPASFEEGEEAGDEGQGS